MAGGRYELAKAYVSVIASTKGAGKDLISEMTNAGDTAGEQAGKSIGTRLGGVLNAGLKTAGLAGASALGLALTRGFSRLKAIDTAQAKLRGLGHDGESVAAIMQNASASVKGTSFGLDEAATTAAGAVASGIMPGEELEKVLKSVANSAAASGSSMSEMGAIYNKVASTGKAQNDVLAQVADRGIPIYQALADQLGVTAGEVFDLASAGKIGFAEFEAAMTAASGTVATEIGKTLPGAFSNAMAAIGRFGANIISGVYPQLTEFFLSFQEWMGPVEELGKVIGERLGIALENLAGFISQNQQAIGILAGVLVTGVAAWKTYEAAVKVATATTSAFKAANQGLRPALEVAKSAATGYKLMAEGSATSAKAVAELGRSAYLGATAFKVKAAATAFLNAALTKVRIQMALATKASAALGLALLKNPITWVVSGIAAVVAALTLFFTKTETGRALWESFTASIASAVQKILPPLQAMAAAVAEFFTTALAGIGAKISQLLPPVLAFVTGVGASIGSLVSGVLPLLGQAFGAVFEVVKNALAAGAQAFGAFM